MRTTTKNHLTVKSKKTSPKEVETMEVKERPIKKRYVFCQFDPNVHRLIGTYLDLDHASNVTGIHSKEILNDIQNDTETTGYVWIKSPVGKTINHRIINKYAREKYKKVKTVSRGRRPIKREESLKNVKNINIESLDDASLKKLARILKNAKMM